MQTHYQTTLFQFLMVRLKAAEPQRIEELKRAFQFLMVRLKGRNGVNLNFFIAFQFLMVRLKVTLYTLFCTFGSYFNSLWCD